MGAANLNIVTINRRMLTTSEAAQYCGLPVKRFPAICTVSAVELDKGIVRYDRHALDRWLDDLSNEHGTDDDILARLG
ncbi:MAG: hypothetical protein CMJ42_11655 [Phyllobacteriaceae bacterium]|nr:hypothetical protein [Phyllobacteriaceae bacterium]MBA90645.1 hypothetical protein [Phyllobacteriaceae bacterium]|tara:strand:+ start:229 stop:462 length:234 start_codon:yes stop_codon:yes gene_type:complete